MLKGEVFGIVCVTKDHDAEIDTTPNPDERAGVYRPENTLRLIEQENGTRTTWSHFMWTFSTFSSRVFAIQIGLIQDAKLLRMLAGGA